METPHSILPIHFASKICSPFVSPRSIHHADQCSPDSTKARKRKSEVQCQGWKSAAQQHDYISFLEQHYYLLLSRSLLASQHHRRFQSAISRFKFRGASSTQHNRSKPERRFSECYDNWCFRLPRPASVSVAVVTLEYYDRWRRFQHQICHLCNLRSQ